MDDPTCECGDLQSQHVDNEAQCFIPECRCKEFSPSDEVDAEVEKTDAERDMQAPHWPN
jgi:hypothetical protein